MRHRTVNGGGKLCCGSGLIATQGIRRTMFGLLAGFVVLGGWWSLFAFCAVLSIGIGSWRILGAYRRLASGDEYVRKVSDARNIAITSGAESPDVVATKIIGGGQLPKATINMHLHAWAWEFITVAIFATIARFAKIFFL